MTEMVTNLYVLWQLLTGGTIICALILIGSLWRMRNGRAKGEPVSDVQRVFTYFALAVVGVCVEVTCAELAASFYAPGAVSLANVVLRDVGRAIELLTFVLATYFFTNVGRPRRRVL